MPKIPPVIRPIEPYAGFYIRTANALQMATISDISIGLNTKSRVEQIGVMAEICAMLVCDEAGNPMFESASEVLEEPGEFVNACAEAALSANGMGEAEEDRKNS